MAAGRRQAIRAGRQLALLAAAGCVAAALLGVAEGNAEAAGLEAGRLWVGESSLADASEAARTWRGRRNVVNAGKAVLLLAGAGLLAWGAWLRRSGRATAHARLRDGLLAALGVLGFAGWWNFGLFHYPDFLHTHELYHYVIGARYAPELGHERLYACTVVADVEAGLGESVARRRITDLASGESMPAARAAASPAACKRHFAPERWELFRHDLAWFRSRMSPEAWAGLQLDHGYNPSPVWALTGRLLVGGAPLDDRRIATLALVDPILEALLWFLAFSAFGWRSACVALLYWGTNHPAEYGWVGGAFLRHDWLLATVAGIGLLRAGASTAGGFLLGWAALLRVFPLLYFVPFALAAMLASVRARRLVVAPAHLRVAGGALLAALVLLPLSAWRSAPGAWPAFVENIVAHSQAPSSSTLGLGTLIAFSPEGREVALREHGEAADDLWRLLHREQREQRWALHVLVATALLLLTARATRGAADWELAVLGVGVVPLLVDASSYYSAGLLAYGLLSDRRPAIGAALCLFGVSGWAAAALWLSWDDISTATSAAQLALVAFAAWWLPGGADEAAA